VIDKSFSDMTSHGDVQSTSPSFTAKIVLDVGDGVNNPSIDFTGGTLVINMGNLTEITFAKLDGTTKLAKLDSSGNMTVLGGVNSNRAVT